MTLEQIAALKEQLQKIQESLKGPHKIAEGGFIPQGPKGYSKDEEYDARLLRRRLKRKGEDSRPDTESEVWDE